jgi:hypothetical protein
MAPIVNRATVRDRIPLPDKTAGTAKAGIRSADTNAYYAELGACMKAVMRACDLSLEEFAYALKKDERYIARQLTGEDKPQIDAVFAVERFRAPLVIALAALSNEIEVTTQLTYRKSA